MKLNGNYVETDSECSNDWRHAETRAKASFVRRQLQQEIDGGLAATKPA